MRRVFQGMSPGDVCTGTISFFGLQSSDLARKGMIKQVGLDWVLVSVDPQEVEAMEELGDD